MKSMKWIGLAVLLAVGVTLLASTPAWADPWWHSFPTHRGPCRLENVGDEPEASGQATLSHISAYPDVPSIPPLYYTAELTVKCTGLKPGATYSPGGSLALYQADHRGAFTAKGEVVFASPWDPFSFGVVVTRTGASGGRVLAGVIH